MCRIVDGVAAQHRGTYPFMRATLIVRMVRLLLAPPLSYPHVLPVLLAVLFFLLDLG